MMLHLIRLILSGHNQFASGGLLLMLVGGVIAYLRALPQHLWAWIENQVTMTVTVKDDDAAFKWVKEWFLGQKFLERIRRLDLDTTLRGADLALVPAPGCHLFWRGGRPVWVWFHRNEETHGWTPRRTESLTFQTVGRDRAFLHGFVDEVIACHRKKQRTASHLYVYDEGWTQVEAYAPRLLESVLLKPGEKEHLLADISRFRAARPRYRRLGVPYHRGYLLYGPPGTGKTSLVSALAARFGMSIYSFNLAEMNDRVLRSAMNDVPENSVLLFEDIDCMRTGNRRAEATSVAVQSASPGAKGDAPLGSVTLSGLLNVLDGFYAPENVIYVMTTNHAEALDPALLRPGRIDYKLYLGEAAASQKTELYQRFFPRATEGEAREFADAHTAETMAEFQGLLLALEQDWSALESVGVSSQ